MKRERHAEILRLISENDVQTQDEILTYLRKKGFNVTQATVSRDIKELKLVKVASALGYKYSSGATVPTEEMTPKFRGIFRETVTKIDYAGNIVVIKCYIGMANAACAALDSMNYEDIVGTLSGDDTIFIVTRNERAAVELAKALNKLI